MCGKNAAPPKMKTLQDKIYSYFEREPLLRVLFIFNDPFMLVELQDMAWKPEFEFVEFKGDWFTTKYRLDHEWQEKKIILYMNMESPLKRNSLQEKFPLMDVLVANMEYQAQDYAAFMPQNNIPASMATFVERNLPLLQSERLMRLLQPHYEEGTFTKDLAVRAMLSSFLHQQRILEWDAIIIRILLQGRSSEQKRQLDFFIKLNGAPLLKEALDQKVASIFGKSFDYQSVDKASRIVQVLKYNAIVQNLAPVEADNYKAYRIMDAVALQQMNRMMELAMSQPKSAEAFLETIDELGADIREEEIIRWYGTDANYHFVPDKLCIPILKTLMVNVLENEPEKALERIESLIMKNGESKELASVMDYDRMVARFYEDLHSLGSLTLNTPDEYVAAYEADYYLVDQLYRNATEAYYQLSPTSALYDTAQQVKRTLDGDYAKWCNRLNLEWTRCVKEAGGFGALHGLRQQDFFSTVIKPIQKKVAVIVCDALRYEIASSVVQELAKYRHIAKLSPAITMLPTETKYCKPALLPHKTLTLYTNLDEPVMGVDGKQLDSTKKRSDHLQMYRDNSICVPFEEVVQYNQDKNREIFKHPLVYIFHNSIDEQGHDGTGKQVVTGCTQAIEDISTLVAKILSSYNVTEVYVTSDHGFIFNDIDIEDKDKQKITEECMERKSRYYLTKSASAVPNIVKYPLGEVSDIENADGIYVAVPEGTNRLAAPSGGYTFAHGGASLQEMIIPVVVCRQEREDTKRPVGVVLLDRNLSVVSSRLRFKLLQTEAVSMDMKERIITIGLYANDKPVTAIQQITLDKTEQLLDARKIPVDLTLTQNVNAKVLQLKVYDIEDDMNPIIKENVTNNTLIENDFDF